MSVSPHDLYSGFVFLLCSETPTLWNAWQLPSIKNNKHLSTQLRQEVEFLIFHLQHFSLQFSNTNHYQLLSQLFWNHVGIILIILNFRLNYKIKWYVLFKFFL